MRRLFLRVLLSTALGALLFSSGCDELAYRCHGDANCVVQGVQGRCVSAGSASYCAFPYQQLASAANPSAAPAFCPTGLRWDTSAPEEIQGSCVVLLDGGTPPAAAKDGP